MRRVVVLLLLASGSFWVSGCAAVDKVVNPIICPLTGVCYSVECGTNYDCYLQQQREKFVQLPKEERERERENCIEHYTKNPFPQEDPNQSCKGYTDEKALQICIAGVEKSNAFTPEQYCVSFRPPEPQELEALRKKGKTTQAGTP